MKFSLLFAILLLSACAGANKAKNIPAVNTQETPKPVVVDETISKVSVVVDFNHDELITACVADAVTNDIELKKGRFAIATYDKTVLLAGGVPSNDLIDTASRMAWTCKDVFEVKNKIIVDKFSNNKDLKAKDETILSDIMRKLNNTNIVSENYRFAVYKGKVYIIGMTSDIKELYQLLAIIRRTEGISNIINYVKVRK